MTYIDDKGRTHSLGDGCEPPHKAMTSSSLDKLKEEARDWIGEGSQTDAFIDRAFQLGRVKGAEEIVDACVLELKPTMWVACLEERCKDRTCNLCKAAQGDSVLDKNKVVAAARAKLDEIKKPKG